MTEMLLCLQRLETDNQTVVKTGRTHLQGRGAHHLRPGNQRLAVHAGARPGHDPRLTGQACMSWPWGEPLWGRGSTPRRALTLRRAEEVARLTGLPFRPAPNKFHACPPGTGWYFPTAL